MDDYSRPSLHQAFWIKSVKICREEVPVNQSLLNFFFFFNNKENPYLRTIFCWTRHFWTNGANLHMLSSNVIVESQNYSALKTSGGHLGSAPAQSSYLMSLPSVILVCCVFFFTGQPVMWFSSLFIFVTISVIGNFFKWFHDIFFLFQRQTWKIKHF